MPLDKILEVLKLVTSLVPVFQQLFADATAGLSNEQRIALLREAGLDLEQSGLDWLKTHGYI